MSTAWNAQVAAEARLAQVGTDAGAARWYLGLAMERIAELEKGLNGMRESLYASVDLCCGDDAGGVHCENYGCVTILGYAEDIDALLASPTRGEGEAE